MDSMMVFDEKAKNRMGLICFIPVAAFLTCLGYFLLLLIPAISGSHEPGAVVGIRVASNNYFTIHLYTLIKNIQNFPLVFAAASIWDLYAPLVQVSGFNLLIPNIVACWTQV